MPSTSKAQQKFMGLVHAYKKGEVKGSEVSKAIKKAAKSMKKSSTKKYASTNHKGLPNKVKEEGFGGELKGSDKQKFEKARKANGEQLGYKLSGTSDVKEDRDYKEEYKKYGSSTKSKKYRAELNQYNRKKGTYGNGDGKDASHKGGKIVGFESQSKNRGRAEKSRLKKEAVNEDGHTDVASAERKLKLIVKDAMDTINQLRNMSNEDSLPSWWTDKITLAKDYVSKSRDYITNPAESFEEGFGGDLKGEEKMKFEKARKANGEQLGYKLSGTSDIKESVNEIFPKGAGKKISKAMQKGRKWSMHVDGKKIKTYTSKRAAVIAHNKFMKDTDNWKEVSIQAESINEKTVSIGGEELLKFLMKRFKMSKSQAIASMKKHKMDMSFLKNESVNEMVKPGDVFQDYYKKGVEIAVEKSMGKWKTVSFNLKTMSAHEVGTNNTLEKQKSMKLSSSDKMKIKKIVKNPQEADYINQDDSNMAKKLLRVLNEAFKKESVKESIQLPHGMELGKVFTGHGKSFVKEESVNEDVGVETILGGIVQAIQKAGLKPKSAKLMKSGFKVSKRDKVGFVIDVEIRGFDKKEIHKMQFEVERGMLYLILNNKPVKLGKWTMGTMVTKNLKKIALTLSGQKGSPKRIA